jgi:hypothetical protein
MLLKEMKKLFNNLWGRCLFAYGCRWQKYQSAQEIQKKNLQEII